jgi:hypothetical protein
VTPLPGIFRASSWDESTTWSSSVLAAMKYEDGDQPSAVRSFVDADEAASTVFTFLSDPRTEQADDGSRTSGVDLRSGAGQNEIGSNLSRFQELQVKSQQNGVVRRIDEILFGSEVSLCGLDRSVPEEKLNLFQIATPRAA